MDYSSKTQKRIDNAWRRYREAERERRDLTPDEQAEMDEAVDVSSRERSERAFTKALGGDGPIEEVGDEGNLRRDPGRLFVESSGFKAIADPGARPQRWSTGALDVGQLGQRTPLDLKGTLLEGTGAPGTGTGGGLVPVPTVIPGVTTTLFQRLSVADLFSSGTTDTSTVRYAIEGTATSGAAGVAEGGTKPESTLGLSTVDEPVKKIATALTVSDELLEDNTAVQAFVSGRLSLFVTIEEERQLLRGAGGNELSGLVGRSGVNTWARGTVDSNAVALFKAANGLRGSSFLEPDGIIMNPTNWQTARLGTDSAGQFFGGGPFLGPYGGPQGPAAASGQATGATDTIWNMPTVVTSAVGAGTAIVGAFGAGAQVVRRGGVSIEATNSHDTYFLKNLVSIRAEERLALCVFRPASFCVVSGLS